MKLVKQVHMPETSLTHDNIPAPETKGAFKNQEASEQADSQALSHFSKLIEVPDYIPFRFARTGMIYRVNPKKERIETLHLKSSKEFNDDLNNPDLKESHKTTFKWVGVTSVLTAYNITFNPQRVHKDINLTEDMYADFICWLEQFGKNELGADYTSLVLSRPEHQKNVMGEEVDMPLFIKRGALEQEYYESYKTSQYQLANKLAEFVRHGEVWHMSTIRAYLDWKHQAEYNGWPTE